MDWLTQLPIWLGIAAASGNPQIAGAALGGRLPSTSRTPSAPAAPQLPPQQQGASYRAEESMEYYLSMIDQLMGMGYDASTATAMAGSMAGGGGGFGGIDTAARDAALANVAGTYANAAATFQGSEDAYRTIFGDERTSGETATQAARTGAEDAFQAALASRAAERAALGIEDAGNVGIDTVANERQIAGENIDRSGERAAARTQGHLDNALAFNTDLRAVVELEGREKQREIEQYYANQLAQISARGAGGGGRSSGGGSSSRGLTAGQRWNAARDLQSDDLRRLHGSQYGDMYQRSFSNSQQLFPGASLSFLNTYTKNSTPSPWK